VSADALVELTHTMSKPTILYWYVFSDVAVVETPCILTQFLSLWH